MMTVGWIKKGSVIMNDLTLQFHKCPKCRVFTEEEEHKYFPDEGEEVLGLMSDGSYKFLEFNFMYGKSIRVRAGHGETIWYAIPEKGKKIHDEGYRPVFTNTSDCQEVIGWYRLPEV